MTAAKLSPAALLQPPAAISQVLAELRAAQRAADRALRILALMPADWRLAYNHTHHAALLVDLAIDAVHASASSGHRGGA